jgi:hypothetical protein
VDYVQPIDNTIKFELEPRAVRNFTLILETKHGQSQTRTLKNTDSHRHGQSQIRTVTNKDTHQYGQSPTRHDVKDNTISRTGQPSNFAGDLIIVTFINVMSQLSRDALKRFFHCVKNLCSRKIRFKIHIPHTCHMSISFRSEYGNG